MQLTVSQLQQFGPLTNKKGPGTNRAQKVLGWVGSRGFAISSTYPKRPNGGIRFKADLQSFKLWVSIMG